MTASATPAIATRGLSKDYGSGRGVFELDLEVRRGEVFGFLGPNGAGKSTTLRMLLDLIRPAARTARVLGLDTVRDSLQIRRRVGFLPGDLALYPKLTGRVVLDYLAELRGGVDRRVRDALVERFDADIDRPVRQLSTGNRQKLGLVQAFTHEPELLILDEPISGLDPLVQQSFHALLDEVSAQGRTVFLSSHTLSEVERVTDRLAILRRGRLVVVDSVENLRRVAVQRLEFEFAAPVPAEEFRGLPGVTDATAAAHTAVGHTIGTLNVPHSVAQLLGGADYGAITGWFRSEIAAIYGPLVIGALAITGAVAATAGEEEDRILALALAHPIKRSRLIAAKATGIAAVVVMVAAATWIGLIVGVAVGGGGITIAHITALATQLAFFGLATGAVAIALGGATGRRPLAAGAASGIAVAGWLINSFAPLVNGLDWLKYLSPFYYYARHDPLGRGFDLTGILVLGALTLLLAGLAVVGLERRDLRA